MLNAEEGTSSSQCMEEKLRLWKQQREGRQQAGPSKQAVEAAAKRTCEAANSENNFCEPKKRRTEVQLNRSASASKLRRSPTAQLSSERPDRPRSASVSCAAECSQPPAAQSTELLESISEKLDSLLKQQEKPRILPLEENLKKLTFEKEVLKQKLKERNKKHKRQKAELLEQHQQLVTHLRAENDEYQLKMNQNIETLTMQMTLGIQKSVARVKELEAALAHERKLRLEAETRAQAGDGGVAGKEQEEEEDEDEDPPTEDDGATDEERQ